jgi:hypothetical protein
MGTHGRFLWEISKGKKDNYNNEQERNLFMTAAARYSVLSIRVYTIVGGINNKLLWIFCLINYID